MRTDLLPWLLQFPPTVQKHALQVDWELLIVPRCECASEYYVCLSPSDCWDASSTARLLGLVVVNRGQMDGLKYIYFSIFKCPLGRVTEFNSATPGMMR